MINEIIQTVTQVPTDHLVMVSGIAAMGLAGFTVYAILQVIRLSKGKD